MKKKILFIICLLLLTGCDAVYNINIGNSEIKESTNIYFSEKDYNYESYYPYSSSAKRFSSADELIQNTINSDYKAFDNYNSKELYMKKRISDNNGEGVNLKYTYNYNNINSSSLLNYCGDIVKYVNDGDSLSFNVDNLSLCNMGDYGPHLNKFTVNVKTDLKVTENNADKVKNNTYTWVYKDSSDLYTKSIKIVMKKSIISSFSDNHGGLFIFIIIIILIISFAVYRVFRKRYINNNSI